MEAVVERAANLEEAAECEVSWVFPLCCNSKKKNEQTHTVLLVRNGLVWLGIILEANAADPLGALLSRAMVAKVELEVRLQMRWASLM